MCVQGRSLSVLEVTEQQPNLLKNLVQMFSFQAPQGASSTWWRSQETGPFHADSIEKELLLQRMKWGDR